jgi:hypothetical protein
VRGLSLLLFTVRTLGCAVGCSAVLVFFVAVMCLMVRVLMWRKIVVRALCEVIFEDDGVLCEVIFEDGCSFRDGCC